MGTACTDRKEVPWGPMRREHSLDAIMQTAMSITIGLARKDLVAYFTYILGYSTSRLESVQNGPQTLAKSNTHIGHDSHRTA